MATRALESAADTTAFEHAPEQRPEKGIPLGNTGELLPVWETNRLNGWERLARGLRYYREDFEAVCRDLAEYARHPDHLLHLVRPTPEEEAAYMAVMDQQCGSYKGFETTRIPVIGVHGAPFEAKIHRFVPPDTDHPEHATILLPGWNGGPSNFDYQVQPDSRLRESSIVVIESVGSYEESMRLFTQDHYTPDDCREDQIRAQAAVTAYLDKEGHETFSHGVHSKGGRDYLEYQDYEYENNPELVKKRFTGTTFISTSSAEHMARGSFLDMGKMSLNTLTLVMDKGVPVIVPALRRLGSLERRMRGSNAEGYTFDQLGRLVVLNEYIGSKLGDREKLDSITRKASLYEMKRHRTEAMLMHGRILFRPHRAKHYRKIDTANVVMHGSADRLLYTGTSHVLARNLNAPRITLEGSTHFPLCEPLVADAVTEGIYMTANKRRGREFVQQLQVDGAVSHRFSPTLRIS